VADLLLVGLAMPYGVRGGRPMKKAKDSNPDRTGAKSKQRVSRDLAMILTAINGFYGASTSAGFFLGHRMWSNSTILTKFVNDHHTSKLVAPASETSPAVVELSIKAGNRQYVYRSDTDEVRSNSLPPDELAAVPTPTVSSDSDPLALLTAQGAVDPALALAKAMGWLAHLKGKGSVLIVGVAIVGSGAALGCWWGYKGGPNGSAAFQSALMNPDRWRAAAKKHLPPAVRPAIAPDASPQEKR
jgi:hypothetical protein